MTATPPACTDCGEPGFVVTPKSPSGPAVVLCCDCYAARWRATAERAREAETA